MDDTAAAPFSSVVGEGRHDHVAAAPEDALDLRAIPGAIGG
jgi:hypothetical protein